MAWDWGGTTSFKWAMSACMAAKSGAGACASTVADERKECSALETPMPIRTPSASSKTPRFALIFVIGKAPFLVVRCGTETEMHDIAFPALFLKFSNLFEAGTGSRLL